MSVYLGTKGRVELRRTSERGTTFKTTIETGEVIAAKKLLELDKKSIDETSRLITGDEISLTASQLLTFIDSWNAKTGSWFVHVDDLGGVRLYTTFANAVTGGTTNAVALNSSYSGSIEVTIKIQNAKYRILGQTTSYELNTNREAVDITVLGDKMRHQVSSLISGSGRIESFWDYRDTVGSGDYESSQYLYQLLLRAQLGSTFDAHLYVKTSGYSPSGDAGTSDDVIYYQVSGILTGTALAFDVANLVKVTADFVTTGEIKLVVLTAPEYAVLLENGDDLLIYDDGTTKDKMLLESE